MSNSYLKTSTRSIIKYCNKAVNQIKLTHLLEVLGFYTRDRYSTRPGSLMRLWSQNGPYVSSELQGNPLQINVYDTVDGRNPGNQLRLVVYPIIYRVLYHKQYDILHTSTIIYLQVHIASLQPECCLSPYALFAQLLTNALLGTDCSFRFHETDAARASYCRNGTMSILGKPKKNQEEQLMTALTTSSTLSDVDILVFCANSLNVLTQPP